MKAIGGYFELECRRGDVYHKGVYLNSGSNALRYIIRVLSIKRLYVPTYTCHVVPESVEKEGCEVGYYDLDDRMMPDRSFAKDDFVLYNNYFGVLGLNVEELAARYPNLIVDNAQAFYSIPRGRACFYSPRKFFGLPDGGIVVGCGEYLLDIPQSSSYERCQHLLKRHDLGAESGYVDFQTNDSLLAGSPIERMSNLTLALMGNLDYESVAQKRRRNFDYLHAALNTAFPFSLSEDDVPLVYPYLTDDATLRTRLIANKIFVAKYWPGLSEKANEIADRVLAIPLDQRYEEEDMRRIVEVING